MSPEILRSPLGKYFIFYAQDKTPIEFCIILLIVLAIFSLIINRIVKKKTGEVKRAGIVIFFANLILIAAFFLIMESVVISSVRSINSGDEKSFIEMDQLLLWKTKANIRGIESGAGKIHTNREGFRSEAEIPLKKEKNEYRILALGDSWVFGLNVDNSQTFCNVLEERLSEKYPDKKITVINGGCPGYCLAQGYIFLTCRGINFKPDLIIVKNFYNETALETFNDIYPANSPKFIRSLKFLLWKSNFYLFLRRMMFIRSAQKENSSGGKWEGEREDAYYKWLLGEIDSYCRKKKIPVIYLNLELRGNLDYTRSMRDFAQKEKCSYLEISLDPDKDREFIKIDPVHPGPENHKIIGEKLYDFLVKTSVAF